MSDTLLEATAEGERLTLAGTGAWIAENARSLEARIDAETRQLGTIKRVDIDMGRVDRLDTFGAWLLERLRRDFSARGCDTQVTGLRADYRALMDEVHGIKTERAAAHRGSQLAYAVASIGENIVVVGRSSRSAIRSLRIHDMTWRARARAAGSAGKSAGWAGAGNTSSRYSTIALDSVSQKSPWTSAGTLPVKARSR